MNTQAAATSGNDNHTAEGVVLPMKLGDESHQRADENQTQWMHSTIDRSTLGAGKDGHPRTGVGFEEDGVGFKGGMIQRAGDDEFDEEEHSSGVETG